MKTIRTGLDVPGSPPSSVTRRRFLGQSLAASAAPALMIGPLRAAAADASGVGPGATAVPRRKVRLGVVGLGGRGAWIARLFQQHGGYDLWSVADYFPAVSQAVGQSLQVVESRRFSGLHGYRRLIESGVEAVALETPPYFFPEHATAAVDAGLHVYMAKPVAVDVPGCLSIEAAARKAAGRSLVFFVDYQLPTDPHNQEVVRRISAGEIGNLISINSHYFAGLFPDPPKTATLESRLQRLTWCNDVAIGGGYHVNACIHAVDAALWMAGQRPVAALGLSRVGRADPHGDSDDVFQILFEFGNGLLLSHRGKHLNNQTGFDVVCQVQGQTGFAQVGYGGKALLKGRDDGYGGEVQNLYEAGAVRNIAEFHACIADGRTTNDTVRRSIDGALATILGREAGRRRSRVTMAELLQENRRLEVDMTGMKA